MENCGGDRKKVFLDSKITVLPRFLTHVLLGIDLSAMNLYQTKKKSEILKLIFSLLLVA